MGKAFEIPSRVKPAFRIAGRRAPALTTPPAPGFESRRHKRIERDGYNLIAGRYLEGAAARGALTEALLDAANLAPGQTLLDLASGPGVLARAALPRVAPGGQVLACDLAEDILAAGRAACDKIGYAAADAEALPFPDQSFDRVLCGLGLMFFPDELLALAEMRRVLRPGGRLALSVWGAAGQAPFVECALDCLRRLLPRPKVPRPSPLRLAPSLPGLLESAGCTDIETTSCELVFACPDAAGYWQAFLDLAGGAAGSLSRLPAEVQARFPIEVAQELAPHRDGGGYRLASRVLIAVAGRGAIGAAV